MKNDNMSRPTDDEIHEAFRAAAIRDIQEVILSDNSTKTDTNITNSYQESKWLLGDYVTLDYEHSKDIRKLLEEITVYAKDTTLRRPLNIMLNAAPGSGKSQLVKCLAQNLKYQRAESVNYNMANADNIDDLVQPLDSCRNLKVQDKLPILFLDEFDTKKEKYAWLLPLLWDGEMYIGHRQLKLGKLVIILAGSEKQNKQANSNENMNSKYEDLRSRINRPILSIPPLDEVKGDRDRRADKVCLTISLLLRRFGTSVKLVPWSLLHFVALTKFRYGARSIETLIDKIPLPFDYETVDVIHKDDKEQTLPPTALDGLPLNSKEALNESVLPYHLDKSIGLEAVVKKWNETSNCKVMVRILPPPENQQKNREYVLKLMKESIRRTAKNTKKS